MYTLSLIKFVHLNKNSEYINTTIFVWSIMRLWHVKFLNIVQLTILRPRWNWNHVFGCNQFMTHLTIRSVETFGTRVLVFSLYQKWTRLLFKFNFMQSHIYLNIQSHIWISKCSLSFSSIHFVRYDVFFLCWCSSDVDWEWTLFLIQNCGDMENREDWKGSESLLATPYFYIKNS